jgi:hypothetical protein
MRQDISSCSDNSSDNHFPITPVYDGRCDDLALRARVDGERNNALNLLESKDPMKSRRRASELLLDKLRSSPSPTGFPNLPSFGITSPRPILEFPSLTKSLSVYPSSSLASIGHGPSNFTSIPAFSQVPSTAFPVDPSIHIQRRADRFCDIPPLNIDIERARAQSPPGVPPTVVLGLVEPSSPDLDHFSPLEGIFAFSSPASSQLRLDRHVEDDRTQEVNSPFAQAPFSDDRVDDDVDDIRLESLTTKGLSRRRSFIEQVKTVGFKVKRLFSSQKSAPDLVSPRTPSYLCNLQLPQGPGVAAQDDDLDSSQLPAFTLTDAPLTAPRASRFTTITERPQLSGRRSRRFSLPLLGRARSDIYTQTALALPASAVHLPVADTGDDGKQSNLKAVMLPIEVPPRPPRDARRLAAPQNASAVNSTSSIP